MRAVLMAFVETTDSEDPIKYLTLHLEECIRPDPTCKKPRTNDASLAVAPILQ